MKQYTIAGKYFDLKGEAITITTRKRIKAFLFITFLLVSLPTLFSTSCQVIPKEENNKEEMTHIPSPSNITLIKEGQEFSVNQKSQDFKALSKAFQECLRNPQLKNDSGGTLEHVQYLALIDSVHKKGNGLEVSYKLPVELTFWLDGELQQKKLTKEYCRGQPTFLILLEGPYSGKMIGYEKGNPDPAPLFYYPVRNFKEIQSLFQKILADEK